MNIVRTKNESNPPNHALSPDDWAETRDAIVIAHDALGDGPEDVDKARLRDCCQELRIALKRVHRVMEGRA